MTAINDLEDMTPKDNQPSDDTRNIDPRRAAREEQGHIMPKRIEDALNPQRVGENRYKIADGRIISRQRISQLRNKKRGTINVNTEIGYTLRLLQEITKKSNADVAEASGLSLGAISVLRRNTSHSPRLKTVEALTGAFSLTVGQFVTFADKVNQLYEEEKASGQD